MIEIRRLESEIIQKTKELDESLKKQTLLREYLESQTIILKKTLSQIKNIQNLIKSSDDYINHLKQENKQLRLSCDQWSKRAIELEFKVLNMQDTKSK